MNKPNLCISFSGGRTSAFMTKWCLENLQDQYEMAVVFANTGKEREETLEFVEKCDSYYGFNVTWIEAQITPQVGKGSTAKIVDFKTASRNGEPFEALIKKFGLPNRNNSFCSRDLKATAINSFCKVQLGWKKNFTAIGIRADEPNRLNWTTAKKNRLIYPLATMVHTTKSDINRFWSLQPFDLEIKSYEGNCDLCWKKSFRKLMTIAKENPQLTEWWLEMEQKYGNHLGEARQVNPNIKLPMRMFRDATSIEEIIEDAALPFDPAQDESKTIDNQLALWSDHLDGNFGCVESCEAY